MEDGLGILITIASSHAPFDPRHGTDFPPDSAVVAPPLNPDDAQTNEHESLALAQIPVLNKSIENGTGSLEIFDEDHLRSTVLNRFKNNSAAKPWDVVVQDILTTIESLGIVAEVDRGARRPPFRKQANLDLNSEASLRERAMILRSKRLQTALWQWWEALPKTNYDQLSPEIYVWLCEKLYWKLIPDGSVDDCIACIQKDWEYEARDGPITFQSFYEGMFYLADIWSAEISEDAYVRFVYSLFFQLYADIDQKRQEVYKHNAAEQAGASKEEAEKPKSDHEEADDDEDEMADLDELVESIMGPGFSAQGLAAPDPNLPSERAKRAAARRKAKLKKLQSKLASPALGSLPASAADFLASMDPAKMPKDVAIPLSSDILSPEHQPPPVAATPPTMSPRTPMSARPMGASPSSGLPFSVLHKLRRPRTKGNEAAADGKPLTPTSAGSKGKASTRRVQLAEVDAHAPSVVISSSKAAALQSRPTGSFFSKLLSAKVEAKNADGSSSRATISSMATKRNASGSVQKGFANEKYHDIVTTRSTHSNATVRTTLEVPGPDSARSGLPSARSAMLSARSATPSVAPSVAPSVVSRVSTVYSNFGTSRSKQSHGGALGEHVSEAISPDGLTPRKEKLMEFRIHKRRIFKPLIQELINEIDEASSTSSLSVLTPVTKPISLSVGKPSPTKASISFHGEIDESSDKHEPTKAGDKDTLRKRRVPASKPPVPDTRRLSQPHPLRKAKVQPPSATADLQKQAAVEPAKPPVKSLSEELPTKDPPPQKYICHEFVLGDAFSPNDWLRLVPPRLPAFADKLSALQSRTMALRLLNSSRYSCYIMDVSDGKVKRESLDGTRALRAAEEKRSLISDEPLKLESSTSTSSSLVSASSAGRRRRSSAVSFAPGTASNEPAPELGFDPVQRLMSSFQSS